MMRNITARKSAELSNQNKNSPSSMKLKNPEYSIYAFARDDQKYEGCQTWEMKHKTTNMAQALKRARVFYDRKNYARVEVKQKQFDAKNDRNIDVTLRAYDREHKFSAGGLLMQVALISASIGFIGVGVFWFLF